jgi:hypothetical protein
LRPDRYSHPSPAVHNVRRERVQLIQRAAGSRLAVLEVSFALHPTVVLAFVNDVDFLNVVHSDIGCEHRFVGKIPGKFVSIAKAIGVNLTERFGIAIGSEFVDGRNSVIPETFCPAGYRRTPRVDAQNRVR